jgi:8-hydroxy-5-deazaflavin:NADPH oxidoreductase
MNIGIIGSGMIGGTAARLFVKAGHKVALSNSRGAESLADFEQELGSALKATTIEEACKFGEVIFVSIPYGKYHTLPADLLAGKIVIDSMNYYPQRDNVIDFDELTSSELVAKHLNRAQVIKAFNTMWYQTLAKEGKTDAPLEERLVLFLAGDDLNAKEVVANLIKEIGFAPLDTGSLRSGGMRQQPGMIIYNRSLTPAQARELVA